jgi:mycothiol synthase
MGAQVVAADGVVVPGAPSIHGLRFRQYAGPSDHPGMVRVLNARNEADGSPYTETVDGLASEYANPTNFDPSRDCLIAEVEGAIVAYGEVSWEDQNDGTRAYQVWGAVHPAWRRRGIGRAMLQWNLDRARQVADGHETTRERWFGTWDEDANVGAGALFRSEAFGPIRRFFLMVRPDLEDIAVPSLPDGLEVRPVTEDQWRAIYRADNEAFRDHFGGVDLSEAGYQRWIQYPHFDPSLFAVAWEGNEVAGGVLGLIDPAENERHGYARGWLDSVFTRRPWRKRGLAAALMGRCMVLLRDRGMSSAQLGVDSENPNQALHLYQGAGFGVHSSASAWRRDWD